MQQVINFLLKLISFFSIREVEKQLQNYIEWLPKLSNKRIEFFVLFISQNLDELE
jgi:hypothetical protein